MTDGDLAQVESALVQQLRQSLGMLQVAFDAAAEAMLIIDSSRAIHWANQAAASLLVDGVPIQLVSRHLEDVTTLLDEAAAVLTSAHCLNPDLPLPVQAGQDRIRLRLANGALTDAQRIRWQPIALAAEPFLLITIQDLTPEEEALRQQKAFMTDLSHELRTPLAIVTGTLQRLLRDAEPAGHGRDRLQVAWEEVRRMHQLLEHLTLMTSLQVDPRLTGEHRQSLDPLLRQWHRQITSTLRDRLHLAFAGSQVSPSVRLDPQALWLALDLLVDNAVRHGVADQPIQLVLQLDGSGTSFVLEIISVGSAPPVGPDALQGWLRPFVRAELDRDAHRVEGAGLGLSLVRQLVESWGGTVALSQRQCSPDQQTETCVTVTVPLQEPLGGSEAAPGDEQTDPV